MLENINNSILQAADLFMQSDYLLLTFGTSWVYRLVSSGQIVCNCHKLPARKFKRELLDPREIAQSFKSLVERIRKLNPGIKIIFTISPVRHWKDGATGNQLSKAALILAVNELCTAFPEFTGYFPAYEILLDDLRDYRYYASDLVHPSEEAITYIWEKFSLTYFDEDTRNLNREIGSLSMAMNHRSLFPETENHKKFLLAYLKKANSLQKKYPDIDLTLFISYFGSRHQ